MLHPGRVGRRSPAKPRAPSGVGRVGQNTWWLLDGQIGNAYTSKQHHQRAGRSRLMLALRIEIIEI